MKSVDEAEFKPQLNSFYVGMFIYGSGSASVGQHSPVETGLSLCSMLLGATIPSSRD